jgi:MFS family permease
MKDYSKVNIYAAVVTGLLLIIAGTTMACPPLSVNAESLNIRPQIFLRLWLGSFLGAIAGLMIISHAAGIVSSYGGVPAQVALGTMLVNIGNVTGRFSGGWFSQHYPVRRVLTLVMGSAAIVLLVLALFTHVWVALIALMLIGFAYGSNGSTYPMSVTIYYGRLQWRRFSVCCLQHGA